MHLKMSSAICFNLDQCKILSSGNGLNSSKLNEFAADNFEFDENGEAFSNKVENNVEKGGIARYE